MLKSQRQMLDNVLISLKVSNMRREFIEHGA